MKQNRKVKVYGTALCLLIKYCNTYKDDITGLASVVSSRKMELRSGGLPRAAAVVVAGRLVVEIC